MCSQAFGGQLFLVRAPAHFGGGRAFFAEAFDAPGVDELVHLLRLVRDLRVALAAMNHLHAELPGEMVEALRLGVVSDRLRLRLAEFLVREGLLRNVEQCMLGEMADQPRVGAMFDHRRRPGLAPAGDHAPQIHVPPVERSLGRVLVVGSRVRIPELDRRVHIQDAPVVAPLHDFATIDVPCQVDQEVAVGDVLPQQTARGSPESHDP